MRRFRTMVFICAAVILSGTWGNIAGANAPYKPLQVGTVLDYGSWKCNVVSNNGLETVCAGDKGEKLTLFGHFIAVGLLSNNGYGGRLSELYCPSGTGADNENIRLRQADLNGKSRSDMATIWPLAPGKKAGFTLFLNPSEVEDQIDPIEYSMQVVGKTTLSIAGRRLSVWEVAGKADAVNCGTRSGFSDGFKESWWYSPDLGAVVRYAVKTLWTKRSFELKSIELPGGVPVASTTQKPEPPAVSENTVAVQKPAAPTPPTPKPDRVTRVEPNRTDTSQPKPPAVDSIAPRIDVPQVLRTDAVVVRLNGRVIDQSRVIELTVNGIPVPLDQTGAFGVNRGVPMGTSTIIVAATDEWGNRAEKRVIVTRSARTNTNIHVSVQPPAVQLKSVDPFANIKFGAYHALVIGNDHYRHVVKLDSAINDAKSVANVLRADYGFKVTRLLDATRNDILGSMAELRATLKPHDNLLIYYAGHGVIDEVTRQGYWLPVDAEDRNPANWISNSDLSDMLRGMSARHVMVVADSCYSGSLVRAATMRIPTGQEKVAWVKRMLRKRARTALVSGGLEPVLDGGGGEHSVFAKAFLTALKENNNVMDGQALFDAIKRPVVLNADQTPQYTDIRRAGHDGGEFLFVKTAR
jgi:hypothetical protein